MAPAKIDLCVQPPSFLVSVQAGSFYTERRGAHHKGVAIRWDSVSPAYPTLPQRDDVC
jgi:hypothetical protein